MTRVLGALQLVRPWQWLVLFILFGGAAAATYFSYQWVSESDDSTLAEDQQLIPVQRDDLVTSISINGSLAFPNTETASFQTEGTLGQFEVAEGDLVTEGEVLAHLDDSTVSSLEESLAKARYDASVIEDAISDLTSPFSALDIDQAAAKVSNAQETVRAAEDKLLDLLDVSDHQITTAESAVADALLKISSLEDDIAALSGPDQREFDDLTFQIETAQVALDNALRDQLLTTEEWAEKVDVAREDIGDAVEEYREPFERWLGVDPQDIDDSISPESLLDLWGADLEALFDRSDVDQSLYDPPPDDDPATAWNEQTVYAFTHLSPYEVLAECEEEPTDPNIFCPIEEMSEAWEKVVDARAVLADLETPAATALAKSADAVAKAEEAVSDAKEKLSDLLEPPETFVLNSKEKELAAARTALAEAEADLASLQEKRAWAQVLDVSTIEPGAGKGIDTAQFTGDMSEQLRTTLLAGQMDVEDAVLALREANEALADLLQPVDPLLLALREAELTTARLSVEDAAGRLANLTLTAPIAGVVSEITAEVGDSVNTNTAILTIVDPTVIEMEGAVDEIDVLYVQIGAPANVTMDALPGEVLPGTVSYIASEAVNQQGVVTYDVSVRVETPPGIELRSGLTAIAELVLRSEPDVLLVPLQALRGSFNQPTVLVSTEGVLTERQVSTGSSDDFWVVIEEGLTEGEFVVMEGIEGASEFGFGGFRGIPGAGFGGGFRPPGGGRR